MEKEKGQVPGREGDISKGKLLKELVVFSLKQRYYSGALVTVSSRLRTLPKYV